MEHVVFDARSGQLLTGSFMDYAMPRADDLPRLRFRCSTDVPCEDQSARRQGRRRGRHHRRAAGGDQRDPRRAARRSASSTSTCRRRRRGCGRRSSERRARGSLDRPHPEEHRVSDASRRMGRRLVLRGSRFALAPQDEAERARGNGKQSNSALRDLGCADARRRGRIEFDVVDRREHDAILAQPS